ncbi:hypothetical protein ACFLZ9_00035 [Patescibacteria group bacterium]
MTPKNALKILLIIIIVCAGFFVYLYKTERLTITIFKKKQVEKQVPREVPFPDLGEEIERTNKVIEKMTKSDIEHHGQITDSTRKAIIDLNNDIIKKQIANKSPEQLAQEAEERAERQAYIDQVNAEIRKQMMEEKQAAQ